MQFIYGYKDLSELRVPRNVSFEAPIQKERRGKIRIGVIDDQSFEAGKNLRTYGYDIVEIGDISDVRTAANYPIILCDLMDVGLRFDPTLQGASIIKEIRKNYPSIVVAAYTGSATSSDAVRAARYFADRFIRKDVDMETWTEQLDDLMRLAADPAEIWERTRASLVQEKVPTKQILILEDAYVRSINIKDKSFKAVETILNRNYLTGAAADIAKGVISSAIYGVLFS